MPEHRYKLRGSVTGVSPSRCVGTVGSRFRVALTWGAYRMKVRQIVPLLWPLPMLAIPGCVLGNRPHLAPTGSRLEGQTFYLDGVANFGFGKDAVRLGLADGGYSGRVEHFVWTTYLGPYFDQVSIGHSRRQARRLARCIERYLDEHPQGHVNLIGLSAGSGVAVFALEELKPGYAVDNVVLLSSSLSADYDLTAALQRVRREVYFFYFPNDAVLKYLLPLTGTVDRAPLGVPVAGLIGAKLPADASDETRRLYAKVHNRQWRPEDSESFFRLSHAGSVSRSIIRNFIAPVLAGGPAELAGGAFDADDRQHLATWDAGGRGLDRPGDR